MIDQRGDPRVHLKRLKHVVADKISEISNRFHRDRLMEKIKGLFGFNAKPASEPRAVFGEGIEGCRAGLAEPAAEFVHVRIEIREIRSNVQIPLRADVEAGGRAMRILHPQHAGECDGLIVAAVMKHGEQDGERVLISQANGLRGTGAIFAALASVVA